MYSITDFAGIYTETLDTPADVRAALESANRYGLSQETRRTIDALMAQVVEMIPGETIAHHYAARALGVSIERNDAPSIEDIRLNILDLTDAFNGQEQKNIRRAMRRFVDDCDVPASRWNLADYVGFIMTQHVDKFSVFCANNAS